MSYTIKTRYMYINKRELIYTNNILVQCTKKLYEFTAFVIN